MATTVTINPIGKFWYQASSKFWEDLRNAVSSDGISNTNPGRVGIAFDSPNYIFLRIYLKFDLSVIPEDASIQSITISLKRVDSLRSIYSPIIAYAGDKLNGNLSEYNSYLVNINGDGESLATIDIDDNTQYYKSSEFNDKGYTILPGDTLVVGIIDGLDFNNNIDDYSDTYLIDISDREDQPFLTVIYTGGGGGGYPNNVIGVSSANISSVRGVLSENISKINVI